MSTDDCKKFIESICVENALKQNDKWKRVKKYKEGDLTLRDFQNTNGDVLVISETKDGSLAVYEVKKNIDLSPKLKATLNKENSLIGLFTSTIDGCKGNIDFKNGFYTDKRNGGIAIEALEAYQNRKDDSLIRAEIKTSKIVTGDEIYCGYSAVQELEEYSEGINFVSELSPEKIGVLYDKENVIFTYEEKEGISYFLMQCGGDWEMTVMFYVYWSEKHKRLKGFFPVGDGNVYNQETKTAYGSEMENCDLDFDDPKYEKLEEKYGALIEKIDRNQSKHYEKAQEIGFKQFKEYLAKEYM